MFVDNTPIKQRLHITFGKTGALIYTSNLDTAKLWERVLRRANLPILYSEGFNPRPRIALASALPLGISSQCEILDVSLREAIHLEGLADRITAASPAGLEVHEIRDVPVRSPSLQQRVRSSIYRLDFDDPLDEKMLEAQVARILNSTTLVQERERKGKMVPSDIRPLILGLQVQANALIAHLAVGDQGNLRPDELLQLMGLDHEIVSVHRERLLLD